MTTSLGPTARSLITAARGGLEPTPNAAARVRAKVALAVGGGALVVGSSGAASIAVAPAPVAVAVTPVLITPVVTTTSKLFGIAAAVVATSALAIGAWAIATRAPAAPVTMNAPAIAVTTTATDETAPEVRFTLTAPDRVDLPRGPAALAPPAHDVNAPTTTTSTTASATLAREVALLDRALVELRAGSPVTTLATLAIYTRETSGHGQLAEDAAALEIDAHCHAHEPIRELLAVFDQRWPHSAQRARLATCK